MLHHATDTVDALCQDSCSPTECRRFDVAPEMYDPIRDGDRQIQSLQAGILSKPNKNAAPDGFVANCGIVRFCRVNDLQQIGTTDDADQFIAPKNRNAFDTKGLHEFGNTGKGGVLVDRDGIGRHDITHSPPASLYERVCSFVGTKPHVRILGERAARELRSTDKITFADDAPQTPILVKDRDAADVLVCHQLGRMPNAVVRRQCDDSYRHDIFYKHVDPSPAP